MSTEQFALSRITNSIIFSYHQAYHFRNFGADYGERYHMDPLYRIEQDRKVSIGYYQRFGEFDMGDQDPKPCLGVSIQPLDFMNAALGGKMEYRMDESVWTPDKPLSNIQNMSDLEKLNDIDWDSHRLFLDLFRQIDEMKRAYPDLPISHVQGVWADGEGGQKTFFTMHTPYTTAFRLMGEDILVTMMLDEELAAAIFDYLMRQYDSLWRAVCRRMGWRGTKLHLGDCAATMLSPELYEKYSLPLYQRIMADYEGCVVHSCGRSSHLLELFAQIPKVRQLQLGDGTDLKKARSLFPHSSICAIYDPGQFLADRPDHIERKLWQMCDQLQDNFSVSCGGVDPDTPEENILALLKVANKLKNLVGITNNEKVDNSLYYRSRSKITFTSS